MRLFHLIATTFALSLSVTACAGPLLKGETLEETTLEDALAGVNAGDVVIVSELHGYGPHHRNQRDAIRALQTKLGPGTPVSPALEFFYRPDQDAVDRFVEGALSESEFLSAIKWGKASFGDYRFQALFSRESGGRTLAINAPRSLTGKISKQGLDSLSAEEKALFPANFTLGNPQYLERFKEVMSEHVPPDALKRYFEAQSTWDEFMADSIVRHLDKNPGHVVFVIVGDFHAAYGGGLPDRLRARGAKRVHVFSQVRMSELRENGEELGPHPQWGPRGDYIWVE